MQEVMSASIIAELQQPRQRPATGWAMSMTTQFLERYNFLLQQCELPYHVERIDEILENEGLNVLLLSEIITKVLRLSLSTEIPSLPFLFERFCHVLSILKGKILALEPPMMDADVSFDAIALYETKIEDTSKLVNVLLQFIQRSHISKGNQLAHQRITDVVTVDQESSEIHVHVHTFDGAQIPTISKEANQITSPPRKATTLQQKGKQQTRKGSTLKSLGNPKKSSKDAATNTVQPSAQKSKDNSGTKRNTLGNFTKDKIHIPTRQMNSHLFENPQRAEIQKLMKELNNEEQQALQRLLDQLQREFEQSELGRRRIRREWKKQCISRCKQALLREQKALGEKANTHKDGLLIQSEILEREKALENFYRSQAQLITELDEQHAVERKLEIEELQNRWHSVQTQIHSLRKAARENLTNKTSYPSGDQM